MTISPAVLIDIAKLLEPTAFDNLSEMDQNSISVNGLIDVLSEPQKQMLKNLIDAEAKVVAELTIENEAEADLEIGEYFEIDEAFEIDERDIETTKVATAAEIELQQACLVILRDLNPKYYATRDNPVKFAVVGKLIDSLIAVVKECKEEFSGRLKENPALAEQITQLHFKVSNYYSLASTLAPDNYDLCTEWLNKARDFIYENDLVDTKVHAVWHNLKGGHESRGFEMGLFPEFPHSAVKHFEEAVRIHTEILGSKIDKVADVELRHVTICLADVMIQEAIEKVVSAKQVTHEVTLICAVATNLLAKLPEEVLVKSVNEAGKSTIVPDNYRMADCSKIKAKIEFLHGHVENALLLAKQAKVQMEAAVPKAPGQLALIKNIVTDFYYACGVLEAMEALDLCSGKFEDMYAKIANKNIDCITHKFTALTPMVTKCSGSLLIEINAARELRFSKPPLSESPRLPPALNAGIRKRYVPGQS